MPGTLFVVATPIGNLEDVTARALRVLREVSLIAAEDTRRTAQLLARYAISTPTTSLHEHNERRKSGVLIERLRRNENIALVSDAGTPTMSDPGRTLIQLAVDAGIRVEPVPGPNAAVAALAVSGFPTDIVTFLGFPPPRGRERRQWFERVKTVGETLVFFEAPHRILRTLRELLEHVGDAEVCVARELTKTHEELVRGPISSVLQRLSGPRGEYTIVAIIGHSTDIVASQEIPGEQLLAELGHLTDSGALSRREAISQLARRYSRPRNEVYFAIEKARSSVK